MIKSFIKVFSLSLIICFSFASNVFAAANAKIVAYGNTNYKLEQAMADSVTGPSFDDTTAEVSDTQASASEDDAVIVTTVYTEYADHVSSGPDDTVTSVEAPTAIETTSESGVSAGTFKTTGYCNCAKCCSAGFTLTASGTVPKAGHTVAADLSIFPIGTKIRIGNSSTVYTVEDTGVYGNIVDIYYDNHDQAMSHGVSYEEIFIVK